MRNLMAAIRAAFAAVRFVWVRAADGIGMVMRQVVDITTAIVNGAGAGEMAPAAAPVAAAQELNARYEAIRQLAIAIAAGTDTDADFRTVSAADGVWLSVMSRQSLCRIACSKDAALADHFSGKRMMRGVCAADVQSVAVLQMSLAQEQIEDSANLAQTVSERRFSYA